MSLVIEPKSPAFRFRLLVAMMIVVSAITGLALYVEQRNLASEAANSLRRDFEAKLASLHNVQQVRYAALTERCRALVRRPRIHAALEDNALDLLYPSAQDELRDVMEESEPFPNTPRTLHAEFYRFLDMQGAVISPPDLKQVGALSTEEEGQLHLKGVPHDQQLGYVEKNSTIASNSVSEIIAVPISSTETGEHIAALVLGFKPLELGDRNGKGIRSGIWVNNHLSLPFLNDTDRTTLNEKISHEIVSRSATTKNLEIEFEGIPHLLFYNQLNRGSLYPAAYEICLFPLTDLLNRQRELRWQIISVGGFLLLVGFGVSHFFSKSLSVPVEKLAIDSEENRTQRQRAETALEQTSVELQRAARFSADASHQLKTPVAVLRAGLEELSMREGLTTETREEISDLIHQSYRLTGVVDDLLLLSRMDAGRLRLDLTPVDLSLLLETELDDLSAHADGMQIEIESDFANDLLIAGEKRYTTLIVRNLLENARKYNQPNGRIRVAVREEGEFELLSITNTGRAIPREVQEHIFERFHRGSAGENIPGHGLGLNLARELARLHGGDLRLVRSDESGTEFQVRFRRVPSNSQLKSEIK